MTYKPMVFYARDYAQRGIRVFPVHSSKDGKCSCGDDDCDRIAKHPRNKHGLTEGTTDYAQIDKWWSMWPDANIGIATGGESGVAVIDIDDATVLDHYDFPETVKARTSRGIHLYYKHPGHHVKSKNGVITHVDSKADGGYVIAPPSVHVSGKRYEWELFFQDVELADIPEWWLEALDKSEEKAKVDFSNGENIPEGTRNETIFSYAYDFFMNGKHTYNNVLAMVAGLNAFKCVPPLDPSEVTSIVQSAFTRYNRKMADQQRIDEMVDTEAIRENLNKKVSVELLERTSERASERVIPKPEFMPERGLIREIANHIISQSEWPLPTLAVMAATTFIGALAGRKYRTMTGLGTNIVAIGMAGSGWGKGKAEKVIGDIAMKAGDLVQRKLGPSDIASGSGLISSLHESPSQLFFIDEMGLFLQSVTSSTAGNHKREVAKNMMVLYSMYGKPYRGIAYANAKERPRQNIYSPCLCIYGMTTPSTLFKAFKSGFGDDGFMARLMIVDDGDKRPSRAIPEYADCPAYIVEAVKQVASFRPSVGSIVDNAEAECEMITAGIDKVVYESYLDIDEAMANAGHDSGDETKSSVYSRVAENAIKLALIHAISLDYKTPYISMESWKWGCDISIYCAERIIDIMDKHVSDSIFEEQCKNVAIAVEEICEREDEGCTARDIMRHRLFRSKISTIQRDEYIRTCIESGTILDHNGRLFSAKALKKYMKKHG